MSHINYAFNPEDDALPRDKMKLRNIASTKYSGDWPSIPHSHSYAELFYIVDGEGQFQINDKLFPVQAHQLVVVNPNVIHTEVSFESHPLEYIVLGIEGLEFTISDAAEGSFCIYTFKEDNDVLVCMRKILREMQNRESSFQILCQAYMDIIVVQLMRNASVSAVPIHSRLPANRQCATVKRYIDHHYKENITLDQLAEKVSITKYYMVHAFKREYGVSPINYISVLLRDAPENCCLLKYAHFLLLLNSQCISVRFLTKSNSKTNYEYPPNFISQSYFFRFFL